MSSNLPLLKVNDQHEHFCQLYVITWKPAQAAKDAGFTPTYGYELLKNPKIIDRIGQIQREQGIKMVVDKANVVRNAAYIAYSDITDTIGATSTNDLKALPENVRRAIRRLKITRKPVLSVPTQGVDGDRGAQGNSGGLAEVRYEEHIEIEMHPKTEMIKLLALVTNAIEGGTDDNKRPPFTGLKTIVLPSPDKPKPEE